MLESKFQALLKKEIKKRLPGAIVLKNDPSYIQGIPDLLILYKSRWAALEVKRSENAPRRPNQLYYIDLLNDMSYAAVIFPENKEEILNDMERSLQGCTRRKSRLSRR